MPQHDLTEMTINSNKDQTPQPVLTDMTTSNKYEAAVSILIQYLTEITRNTQQNKSQPVFAQVKTNYEHTYDATRKWDVRSISQFPPRYVPWVGFAKPRPCMRHGYYSCNSFRTLVWQSSDHSRRLIFYCLNIFWELTRIASQVYYKTNIPTQ